MRSTLHLFVLTLLPGLVTTAAPSRSAAADTAKPPNVLVILADDMGYGDIGAFNAQSKIPTPNLDRLSKQGMRFTDAHAPGSVCIPSRYGLLTGRYLFRNPRKFNSESLIEPGRLTIASLLKRAGYTTAAVGKWHLSFDSGPNFDYRKPLRGGPVDRGFDSFFGLHASLDIPPYFLIDNDRPVAAPTEHIEASNSRGWSPIQGAFWRAGAIAPGFHHADILPLLTSKAVDYLKARRGKEQPFFLYVALTAPHTPWLPLEPFQNKSGAGAYGDFAMQVDDAVGRILAALDQAGQADRTLVFFTSDNGPVWFETDARRFGHRSASIYRGMKGDAWEGGHRMPFIARWPGKITPGTTSREVICFTDMLATFASLTGQSLPNEAGEDSFDILPALLGRTGSKPLREATIHQSSRGVLALRQGDWKLIQQLGSGGFSQPARVAPKPGQPIGQLYNLADDPSEQKNLYAEHPEIVRRLTEILERYKRDGRSRPQRSAP
jgi:arylsulfatase A-like enzyme